MEKIYDILIIGGGPAGYSAALYAARAGLSVAVIEKTSVGGQLTLTDTVENYPGFDEGIDGFELGARMQSGAERFGSETIYAEVLSASLGGETKRITTDSGDYLSRTVIIATGAYPRELGVRGERERLGRGVHYCAHCDGRFYRGKTVAVIGGGNSAASDALYLSRLAERVILIHRRDALRAERAYLNELLTRENIEIVYNTVAEEVLYGDFVSGIRVRDTVTGTLRDLACDGVFVSIGRKPATELFADEIALDENGYIEADESTATSVGGVFAAGDVRRKPLRQIVTAVADGATAVSLAERYLSEKTN